MKYIISIFLFCILYICTISVHAQERIMFKTKIINPYKKNILVTIKGDYREWSFFGNNIKIPYTKRVFLPRGKTDITLKKDGKYSISYTQLNQTGQVRISFYIHVSRRETKCVNISDTCDMTVEDFERLHEEKRKKQWKKINEIGTGAIRGGKKLQNWINESTEIITDSLQ